jgi:rubrerythrin
MLTHRPNDDLVDLIRSAIRLELDGRSFYRQASAATTHPSGKRMFLRLAEEEQNHFAALDALLGSLVGESEWQQIAAEEASSADKSQVVDQLETAISARAHSPVADDTQALRVAMELERRALSFFDGLKEHTSDPMQLELLNKLAEEERFHYDLLQAQLDSLLNVGIWLDAPELRMDAKY